VACLQDRDRYSVIIDDNWADVWRRLERPGEPPRWQPLAAALAAAALIQAERSADQDEEEPAVMYRMHPGVAQAIRAADGPSVQAATDTELAAFWTAVVRQAVDQEGGGLGHMVVTAGLSAAPYLLRLQDWDTASQVLEQALNRDRSPGTIQAIVPSSATSSALGPS
jgi:hypothetical protein